MEIKLIAVDMDGTLLDRDHATIPARNAAALRAAHDKGAAVAIASGRTWSLIEGAAKELGVVDYAIVANGAAALDVSSGEWLFRSALPYEQSRQIVEILHAYGLAFEVYCDGKNYLEHRNVEAAKGFSISEAFAQVYMDQVALVDDMARALAGKGFEKFHVFYVDPAVREEVTARLRETGPFSSASGFASNLEIAAPGADKGPALKGLCAKLGIPPEAVMAFGDAENDLGMLTWAGHSFAMANASAQVKEAAGAVTGANHEAGVAQMVERYLLEH